MNTFGSSAKRPPGIMGAVMVGLLALAGCATGSEAPAGATVSTAPGAPGFLVVGLSEQNAIWKFGHATTQLAMTFKREGGGTAIMVRPGCGSVRGFWGSRPCDLTKPERQVLQVVPGEWHPAEAAEGTHELFTDTFLRDQLPAAAPVHVGPGEIVYVGDYDLAADYAAQEIVVRRHSHDDAAAAQAVEAYPGLREGKLDYRDPTAVPAGHAS